MNEIFVQIAEEKKSSEIVFKGQHGDILSKISMDTLNRLVAIVLKQVFLSGSDKQHLKKKPPTLEALKKLDDKLAGQIANFWFESLAYNKKWALLKEHQAGTIEVRDLAECLADNEKSKKPTGQKSEKHVMKFLDNKQVPNKVKNAIPEQWKPELEKWWFEPERDGILDKIKLESKWQKIVLRGEFNINEN